MRDQGAKIMSRDEIENSLTLDAQNSISSPTKKKKIVWRNDSDKWNQMTQGLDIDPTKMNALENSLKLNYGARSGANVIDD